MRGSEGADRSPAIGTPCAWAQSSITTRSCCAPVQGPGHVDRPAAQVDRDNRARALGQNRLGGLAVRLPLSRSMSAITGVAPTATTQLAVAMNVATRTTTSSPAPMRTLVRPAPVLLFHSQARCRALARASRHTRARTSEPPARSSS